MFFAFYYALDRYSSVIHSRLWLEACGLNYHDYLSSLHLFVAATITHFFLQCPNYAVLRPDLLTAAAPIAFDQ